MKVAPSEPSSSDGATSTNGRFLETMVNTSLASDNPFPTAPPMLARWWEGDALARRWPVRRLTATERATVRVQIDWSITPPEGCGLSMAGNAALRLRSHAARGKLLGRSGSHVAAEFWDIYVASGREPAYPWRGFEALCVLDTAADTTGVSVWVDAEPLPNAPLSYRRMRLTERMLELGA